jgi:hypothetical protein
VLTWRPEPAAATHEAPQPAPISLEELHELFESLREENARDATRLRIEPPADLR